MHAFGRDKLKHISNILNVRDIKGFIIEQYESGMSGGAISEWINERTGPLVTISEKSITDVVSKAGKIRSKKESFKLAINTGRMTYKTKDKPFKRRGISLKQRYKIMQRDGFRCVCCGEREYLEVDHIISIENGGSNEEKNLQTLCRACNYGKAMNESEHFKNTK